MKSYTQLTQEQRYQIYGLKKSELSQKMIAQEVGVHPSTISRELKRNTGQRGYRPQQAQELAKARQQERTRRCRIPATTWQLIEKQLCCQWSPQQVSGWLRRHRHRQVSTERIYQYIYADKKRGGTLHQHLRCQKKRRKRYGKHDRRGCIPVGTSIEQRPQIVERRSRIGDWEVDTIIGKGHQQALVSLVERKSRLTLLHKVEHATAEAVATAITTLLAPLSHGVKTITSDNGREFARHVEIAETLEADFYFAHPYSSWERGTNENTNGLVRQYFPKKHSFTSITEEEVNMVMQRLNNRPRKTLNYQTPQQVFYHNITTCT